MTRPKRPVDGGDDTDGAEEKSEGAVPGIIVGLSSPSGLDISSVVSISASFDSGTGDFTASPRAVSKAPPKNGALGSFSFAGASSLSMGSALNVEPRTKLPGAAPLPNMPPGFVSACFAAPPKAEPDPNTDPELGAPNVPPGAAFDPNTLPLGGAPAAAAAKPDVEANDAKPPDDGAAPTAGAAEPKVPAGLPRPLGWPNAEVAVVVGAAAEAQGDAFWANPELPNAGVLVAPKAGAPNAGFGAAGVPKAGAPNAGAVVSAADGAPHGDCLWPRDVAAPKAPVDGAPNAGFAGVPKGEVVVCAGAGWCGCGVPSAMVRPGYMVPWRTESEYTTHHEASTPSLFNTMKAGRGLCDASISSLGMGLMTFSLLERSSAVPMGDESDKPAAIGSCARRESSDISVIAKTPVGASWARAVLARVNRPISVEAVEATMIASCRLGGKSFSRRKK